MPKTIDIQEPVTELCRRLGLDSSYVARIDLTPSNAEITLYQGTEGRCSGAIHLARNEDGTLSDHAATETLTFKVRT